jgi:hypothetical protein
MRLLRRHRTPLVLALAGLTVIACVISTTTRPVRLAATGVPRVVATPLRVHLTDGGLVIFPGGASITRASVTGRGQRYDPTRAAQEQVETVPMDSVLGFETYERQVNQGRTLVYGPLSLAASTIGVAAVLVALFGSCPTIYADSAGTMVLQAESFSNSIAPVLARRDLDRLVVRPDPNGVVRLEVRNEALETHHVDHMELVEFRHRADELVMPATPAGVVAVRDFVVPASVRDGAGRDVSGIVAEADEVAFASDGGLLDRAIAGGPTEDHIDVTVPRSAVGDSATLVLRVRASLLSTTVLYDYMLGRPGASALDWMGRDLQRITTLAELANWYAGHFGLHVSIRDGDAWKPVARMINFGPAAWRDIAVPVRAVERDSVRLRLTFLADEFRLDRVAVARQARLVEPRTVPIARVTDSHGEPRDDVARQLRRADARDLETRPGNRYVAEFDVGPASAPARTFMVGTEGYYTEWVRGSWVQAARDSVPFSPKRTPIRDVLRTWRATRDTLEQRFFTARVPVA